MPKPDESDDAPPPPKKGDTWDVNSKWGSDTIKGTFKAGAETVTVPPHAMVQRPLLTNGSPVDDEGAIVTIRRLGTSAGVWTAYVSTIDGATGDAVTVPALPRGGRLAVDN